MVQIINLQRKLVIKTEQIQAAAERALANERKRFFELNIVLVDKMKMRQLNRRFRDCDEPTDVLAFDYGKGKAEVIVSVDAAREYSLENKIPLMKELYLYIIHGILHLVGYDDESRKEGLKMSKRQNDILESIWEKEI